MKRAAIRAKTKSKAIFNTLRRRVSRAGARVRKLEPIEFKVHVAKDDETGRWYIAMSDIPGLRVEADSADELIRMVQDVAPDLIELNIEEVMAAYVAQRHVARAKAPEKPPVSIRPVFDSAMAIPCTA